MALSIVTLWLVRLLVALNFIAKLAAAAGGIGSAVFWLRSAKAKVPPLDPSKGEGFRSVVLTEEDGSDVMLTLREQSRLSAVAAQWAALAAIGVATVTLLDLGCLASLSSAAG